MKKEREGQKNIMHILNRFILNLIQQEHNRRQKHNRGKETLFAAVHALSGEPGQATRRKRLKRLCQTV